MTPSVPQEDYRQELRRDALESVDRLRAIVDGLDDAQLRWSPPEGGWSIGQVLEHLCITGDSYLGPIGRLVVETPAAVADPARRWRPRPLARWLVGALRSPRRLPAPAAYRPPPVPRPRVAEELARRQQLTVELLDRAAGLDWERIRTRSPIAGFVRLNLGDCFTVLVVHEQRHLTQLERLRAHPGFPDPLP